MADEATEWMYPNLPMVFARLADSLDPRHDVSDTMTVLVEAVVRFTNAVDAGIVLADTDGVLHVVATTGERAAEVEDIAIGTSEGPCLDCFVTGQIVEAGGPEVIRARWPIFARVAQEAGFHAAYTVPLTLRDQHLGALNLFFDRAEALTDGTAAVAQALAQFATIGIVQRRAAQHHEDRAAQLQHALDSRILIEQAKGAVAQQRGVSVEEAFRILRGYARANGARLRDVAERVVARSLTI